MPAASSATCVLVYPGAPWSWVWLLARFMRWKPPSRRTFAYEGGSESWKQSVLPAGHFAKPVGSDSAMSRLPMTRSAASASRTGSKKPAPPLGGRPRFTLPMITSPTPERLMVDSAGDGGGAIGSVGEVAGSVVGGVPASRQSAVGVEATAALTTPE